VGGLHLLQTHALARRSNNKRLLRRSTNRLAVPELKDALCSLLAGTYYVSQQRHCARSPPTPPPRWREASTLPANGREGTHSGSHRSERASIPAPHRVRTAPHIPAQPRISPARIAGASPSRPLCTPAGGRVRTQDLIVQNAHLSLRRIGCALPRTRLAGTA
jgi:hypothetical protein